MDQAVRTTYHDIEDIRAMGTISPAFLAWLDAAPSTLGPDACWPWRWRHKSNAYAVTQIHNSDPTGRPILTLRAHRVAYLLAHGTIPQGLVLDHLCGLKQCCNVAHLEAVTQGENMRRYWASREYEPRQHMTHDRCVRGHEFTPATEYRHVDRPRRQCLICRRLHSRLATALVCKAIALLDMTRQEYRASYPRSVAGAARALLDHDVDPIAVIEYLGYDPDVALDLSPALARLLGEQQEVAA